MKQIESLVTLPQMSKVEGERKQKFCSLVEWAVEGKKKKSNMLYLPTLAWVWTLSFVNHVQIEARSAEKRYWAAGQEELWDVSQAV